MVLKLVINYRASSCGYLRYSRSWSSSSSMELTWNLSCCSFNNWNMASSCFLSVLKKSVQNVLDVGSFICFIHSWMQLSMENVKKYGNISKYFYFYCYKPGNSQHFMPYFIALEKLVEDSTQCHLGDERRAKIYMLVGSSTWKPSICFIITTCTI
jgi:hypothetical protein